MDKGIYLGKGQYIKFLSDDFCVRTIEFPSEQIFNNKEVRVLFKHLISLGYINFKENTCFDSHFLDFIFQENTEQVIDLSLKQWFGQNPFNASKMEYQLIFDIKEIIDKEYPNHLTKKDLEAVICDNSYYAQSLIKDKLGITVKTMLDQKRLIESQKEVVFTDKNVQEVSYEMGYKDPAYFNRVFKKKTGYSPLQFRENFDFERGDPFVDDLYELIRKHHTKERSLGFYAEKMNLSVKALGKKTKEKLNLSLGQLIRGELVSTSKKLLGNEVPIKDIALQLGFEEPNHFTTFFKHHTGINPSTFIKQKVQEPTPFL